MVQTLLDIQHQTSKFLYDMPFKEGDINKNNEGRGAGL